MLNHQHHTELKLLHDSQHSCIAGGHHLDGVWLIRRNRETVLHTLPRRAWHFGISSRGKWVDVDNYN